jgi:hypothetical protein
MTTRNRPNRQAAADTAPVVEETSAPADIEQPAAVDTTTDTVPDGDTPAAADQVDDLTPDAPVTSGDVAPKELEGLGGKTSDGRDNCRVPDCIRPDVVDDAGLCGAHWSLRPDLRRGARRD